MLGVLRLTRSSKLVRIFSIAAALLALQSTHCWAVGADGGQVGGGKVADGGGQVGGGGTGVTEGGKANLPILRLLDFWRNEQVREVDPTELPGFKEHVEPILDRIQKALPE